MQDNGWDVALPGNIADTSLTCPGFESQEIYGGTTVGPVTVFSYHRFKFQLYRLASAITKNIYLRSGVTLKDVVREVKSINQKLLEWEKCIPPELRPESLKSLPSEEQYRGTLKIFQLQALVLQLSYDNVQMVLHRPLLTMNQVPRWPLSMNSTQENPRGFLRGPTDEVNDVMKSSKCQCWVSSLRTSTIGDYPEYLMASRSTYGAAYAAIQSFTSGVVLGIFALSDPLSDQAHQAKRALSKIIKLPKLHKYRTKVSDQCGQILEELLRLILSEEMKSLLVDARDSEEDGQLPIYTTNNGPAANARPSTIRSAHLTAIPDSSTNNADYNSGRYATSLSTIHQDQSHLPNQGSDLNIDSDIFTLQSVLPSETHDGNFSDALLSLQDGESFSGLIS